MGGAATKKTRRYKSNLDHPARKKIKDTISSASPISTRLRLGPRMPTGSRSRERAAPTLIQVRATNLQNRFNIFNDFKI